MRILLLGDYPRDPRLGSAKVLFKLQEELRTLGHTCDLLLADDLGLTPGNAYLRQALAPMMALSAVRRMFREHGRYDIVDIASAEALWVGAMRRVGALQGTAVIARSNGLEHLNYQRMLDDHDEGLRHKPWTRRLFHPLVRLTQVAAAARVADRLILLNDGDRAFALDRHWKDESRIDVIPHGVSAKFLASAPSREATRGRGMLFCGSWTAVKGVSHLATAFSRLIADGFVVNLTILGGAVPDATIEQAFTPEARRHITLLPRLSEADVMEAYRSHDVLVWPSTYEGFGMVVIEAMSQRLPVVATPVGCARTLITDELTGLVVPPRNPEALASALMRAMDDRALRLRLADAALDLVRGMTWTRTAARTLDTYERALHGDQRVHH